MASTEELRLFRFDHDHGVPGRDLADSLGGKGAGLAEMTRALGLPVPPGFTVPLDICRRYREFGWPVRLDVLLDERIEELGTTMGRRFGDPTDPLLVAVRSGSPISMPGMLDTVLNLGLNDETVQGLATVSGDPVFAWDSFRRFVLMYATTVMGVPADALRLPPLQDGLGALRDRVALLQNRIVDSAGEPVPTDPREQLRLAVAAVFDSWDSERARAYRTREGIDHSMGTAVNVQAMVFGNRGADSGTGVVFTRDPATGREGPYGDYLPRAQGEDVVAGTANTLPIAELERRAPAVWVELAGVLRRLEIHYRDMCDVEFTVEQGTLWVLQTRVGKRGAVAAVRSAVALARDPDIALTPAEAVARAPIDVRESARAEILARCSAAPDTRAADARGLGASPGRVTGRIVLSSAEALVADEPPILVRAETNPGDVVGMSASVGILTTSGGLVSHAAVVARGWGIPAVVGARDVVIGDGFVDIGSVRIRCGDVVTVDGSSGDIWVGSVDADAPDNGAAGGSLEEQLPELAVLESWARAT